MTRVRQPEEVPQLVRQHQLAGPLRLDDVAARAIGTVVPVHPADLAGLVETYGQIYRDAKGREFAADARLR